MQAWLFESADRHAAGWAPLGVGCMMHRRSCKVMPKGLPMSWPGIHAGQQWTVTDILPPLNIFKVETGAQQSTLLCCDC